TALAITEAIPVGTYTMVMPPDRPVAYFSFMSERFLELTGLDRARARENPLEGFACVHPDDYDAWLALNAEAFASKRPFKGECRVVLQGETRWVMAESVPRDLPDGSTVWEGVLSDITERVLAQQKLQASEQRLQLLLDNLPIPLLSLGADADTRPLLCNRRFVESFGYSLEALQDPQAWLEQAYPDPQQRALVQQSWHQALAASDTDGSLVSAGEFRLRCADGSERDVLISATRLDDLVVATLVDLSERKQAERALAAARERERQLEEQQRLRLEQKLRTSLTAAAVAHEINQPLSALLLQAKLAQARLAAIPAAGDSPPAPQPAPHSGDGIRPRSTAAGPDAGGDHAAEGNGAAGGRGAAAELATLLASLVRDAERVVQVIGKMRNLLRNVQTEPQPVDLATVVESALLFRRPRLQALGVVLHCRGLEHPCPISGDADQLQVAVSNLLRNALEALETVPAGNRSLEVALEPQGQRVLLRIGDSGGGFEAGVLADLPLATTKPDGTGLGLYVVQTTVDNHGGTLGFGRSPLGGALVELVLPAALPSERVPAPNGDGAGSGEAEPGVEVSAGDSSAPLRPIAQEQ
ncbi:MAG: PAS domain-containing protein, partial [Cyanobium sp.]